MMWGPWMAADYNMHKADIWDDNLSLEEFVAMFAAHQKAARG